MKIACISDIHGNRLALLRVIEDLIQNRTDKLFVLGDLAMGGYDPNFVIEKFFDLKILDPDDIEIIQGNTDRLIFEYSNELFKKMVQINPLMAYALQQDIKEIKKENVEKLKTLKENKIVEIYGVKFMLCHGSPRRQDENILPDTPVNTVEDAVSNCGADVIVCGHTHIPCGFSLESGKTVVNAGSIGRPMSEDKTPCYLMITINPSGEFSFEHKKVKYDNKKVAKIIENRGFKRADEFAKLYI